MSQAPGLGNPFHYLELPREEPDKKGFGHRTSDFGEIYEVSSLDTAEAQAARCIACGNPYCEWRCPVHNYIPNWLQLLAEERILEAAELCHETNSLPEICGRVCPQDRLCEGACTLNAGFGAVTIGQAEKYIVDTAVAQGWRPDLSTVVPTGQRVAIIGAGPAGIGCADRLRRAGIEAVVYDRYPEIGGLLTFGIPEFKLEKRVVLQRRAILEGMGVEFRLNQAVGKDVSFEQLLREYDAVFVGTGCENPKPVNLPNAQDTAGAMLALPYLIANTARICDIKGMPHEYVSLRGRRVLVLGGGDTGMDCNRTAVRQGALSVTCVYRRDEANMPGSRREVGHCREEGVQFVFNQAPVAIIRERGRVAGVCCVRTEARTDDTGRSSLHFVEGSEVDMPADTVIFSFGFDPSPPSWLDENGIRTDVGGRILTGVNGQLPGQTTNPAVFAGGDNVRGADLVVTAVADGQEAAASIQSWLDQKAEAA